MHTSKLKKVLRSIAIFHCHLVSWCKLQIHAVCVPSDIMWVYKKKEKLYTQGQLKLTYINFVILNSHVAVIFLRFVKNTFFQNLLKIENYYLLKSSKISWPLTKNLKGNYYLLYQQTVLLKVIYYLIYIYISFIL